MYIKKTKQQILNHINELKNSIKELRIKNKTSTVDDGLEPLSGFPEHSIRCK